MVAEPPRPTIDPFARPDSEGAVDELARCPAVGGAERVVALWRRRRAPGRWLAPSPCIATRSVDAPRGVDRTPQRSGDGGRAVGPAEHVEDALTAVGHRHLVVVDPELPTGRGHGAGGLGRRRRALVELVEGGEHADVGKVALEPPPAFLTASFSGFGR